jgi:hypothetical protein
MTVQLLRPKARAVAQRFLYVPLPVFGCLLSAFGALPGFKLLQPVTVRGPVERLLQSVPNMFRTVATKSIFAVSVSKPLRQDLQIEGAIRP